MKCEKCKAVIPEGGNYCPMCGKKQSPEKRKYRKRANGTGTVYKLSDKKRSCPWVASKNKVIIGCYETRTEALEVLNKLSIRKLNDRYNMTFSEVYEAWKDEHFPDIGEKGVEGYETAYKVFTSIHDKKFRELRKNDFQKCMEPHMSKSHSTCAKYKQLLTQMSEWAIQAEIIDNNYASKVKLPEEVKKEKEIFSNDDIAKLEANGSETAKVILMLIYTGMRIGELFKLPLADYHDDYVIGGSKTDAGKNRTIPIRPEGRDYFAYFAKHAKTEQLLSGYTGQHDADNFRKRDYYPLLEKLGIERKTPHATRHTYVSWAVKDGMRPEILQKVVGHKDYSTTANIYTHIDTDTLIAAVEKSEPDDDKKCG